MLELDFATVIWQIINFLILAAALYFILFKPAIQSIQARTAEREGMMQTLEADREAAAALRAELEARLANAEQEAEEIVAQAKGQAEVERAELLQEANAEVLRILTEAQADAYRLKQQAVDEFHDDLLGTILSVSGLVIERVAPAELHDALVSQLNNRIWELGRSEMQRVEALRRSLGSRTPTVVARTARPLSPEQQGQLARTFSALADRNINVDIKVEPAMGVGLRVRLGDIVIDNSISGKFEDLRGSVVDALKERLSDEQSAARR